VGKIYRFSFRKTIFAKNLRDFLGEVGESVLTRRFEREKHENPAEAARSFALGYGGLEGLVATSLSVPTSTYPAFWCPGLWDGRPGMADATRTPWTPLFLRTNMLKHLVLG
jgi:hypothetical protein